MVEHHPSKWQRHDATAGSGSNSKMHESIITPVAESPLRSVPGRPAHPFYDQEHRHQLRMVRPTTSLVRVPDVPEGYVIRLYRPDDERAYKDLFNLGFTGDHLKHTQASAIDDGFFVIEHQASGHLVASCVALRGVWDGGHDRGMLGWLIADPSHARLRLGTIVAAMVTNRLSKEGCRDPGLDTEDFRLAAIGIYLKLGWRPYLYLEDMERRWRDVSRRMGRRFLREECVEP